MPQLVETGKGGRQGEKGKRIGFLTRNFLLKSVTNKCYPFALRQPAFSYRDATKGKKYEFPARIPGRTVIITGATSGIGKETAKVLANRGELLHLLQPIYLRSKGYFNHTLIFSTCHSLGSTHTTFSIVNPILVGILPSCTHEVLSCPLCWV